VSGTSSAARSSPNGDASPDGSAGGGAVGDVVDEAAGGEVEDGDGGDGEVVIVDASPALELAPLQAVVAAAVRSTARIDRGPGTARSLQTAGPTRGGPTPEMGERGFRTRREPGG